MARICKNLQVHTKGLLFSKVDTLFPHEHPDSKIHCINTYEAITKGSIWKAINNVIRIFSNSSFNVSASDSTIEFINNTNFTEQNLFSFFLEQWSHTGVATDPNALYAVYPPEYIKDSGGDMIRFISSQFIMMVENDMVVFKSEEESETRKSLQDDIVKRVVFNDPKAPGGVNACSIVEKTYNQRVHCEITKAVYHVFTKTHFIRFTAEADNVFDYVVYEFKTPMDLIPAFPISAVKLQYEINESFVNNFIPFGNLALLQHRNHRAVDLTFSYPRMSEIQTPCTNLTCEDGKILIPGFNDGPDTIHDCGLCHGSGFITAQTPYKIYKKTIDTGLSDPETIKNLLATDPVSFMTPDVAILTYSKDSWKSYLSMAEEAVFVQQKQITGNIEAAKSKELDKEGEYSWVLNISKALNKDLRNTIQCIENYTQSNPVEIGVEQPISFAVVTETEAFEALDIIIGSQAPVFIKAQQVEGFLQKFVSKSSPIVKAINILKVIDPLLFYSTGDISSFKSNNAITVETWTLHIYAYPVLLKLYQADKKLFDKGDADIINLISAEIDKLKPVPAGVKANLLKPAAPGQNPTIEIIQKKDAPLLLADENNA